MLGDIGALIVIAGVLLWLGIAASPAILSTFLPLGAAAVLVGAVLVVLSRRRAGR